MRGVWLRRSGVVLAWVLSLAALVFAALAAFSMLTTAWRQYAYGGDAYGPAWSRMVWQLGCLVLAGALWRGLRAWRQG